MTQRTCIIEGCANKKHVSRGWCNKHYWRYKTYGDPLKVREVYTSSPEESFKIRTKQQGECLIWTGAIHRSGYGAIALGGSRREYAHRYAWERERGPIPEGLHIDHICHNRSCVNIDHLRLATRSQNNAHLAGPKGRTKSGVRNVYSYGSRWLVSIMKDGVKHEFGPFDEVEEAAQVADRERRKLFGQYAGRG